MPINAVQRVRRRELPETVQLTKKVCRIPSSLVLLWQDVSGMARQTNFYKNFKVHLVPVHSVCAWKGKFSFLEARGLFALGRPVEISRVSRLHGYEMGQKNRRAGMSGTDKMSIDSDIVRLLYLNFECNSASASMVN